MMFKKWRPFWSYDIDQTEKWLSEMAQKGYRLIGMNRLTRMFSFEKKDAEKTTYQIFYDKHHQKIPYTLSDAGWENCLSAGNWSILENQQDQINLFPSRDELVKRNRLHALIWKVISVYYGIQLILPAMILMLILSGSGSAEFESSPYWSITILYFLQVITVLILTVIMSRKLRKFERKYYDMEVDIPKSVGETFAKWKPNWMMRPDLTEKWLEKMAREGNHLVQVQATRFLFEKGKPKPVAYALDFQWKAAPAYAEIHKSAGWKFIYKTAQSFLKTSIWAKEYKASEQKPQLTYDTEERKAQKKKVVVAQGGSSLFILFMMGFLLWNTSNISYRTGLGTFEYVIILLLVLAIILWFSNLMKIISYALRNTHE